jgi:tight adherence protein C
MKIAVMLIAALMLLVGVGVMLVAFMKGRGEYEEMLESLDEKEFKLKNFLPIGLFLSERISLVKRLPGEAQNFLRHYNGRITSQITELYGAKDRDFYYVIRCANNWVMSLLVYSFLTLFALISCSNGDYTNAIAFLVAAPVVLCAMPFVMDRELENKVEKRREQIMLEFPEFINKLILLVNAGTTVTKAWEKIVSESKSDTPLYKELRFCAAEIQAGKPESIAYEEFARRCKIKEIIKFVSVIILNLRKGGSEVVPVLRAQADECWETRRATARRLGEKASSKLLLPMAIMLLGIIMVVALPAVLALSGM